MNTITTPNTEQARREIQRAQSLVAASEGRILDFETADEINRALLSSIQQLTPADHEPHAPAIDEAEPTDDEWFEFEAIISRDHDDTQFWTLGGTR